MQQLDKWNRELEQLSNKEYKNMDNELFGYYKQALKDIKVEIKAYIENYEVLSFSKKLEVEQQLKIAKRIDEILWNLNDEVNPRINRHVAEEAKQGYYGTWYALEGNENIQLDFPVLNESYIERLLEKKVAGKTLSKRLYDNRDQLAERVTTALFNGAVKGKGYAKVAKEIGELTEANYKQALRIARTEGGRAQSTSKQKAYVDAKNKGIALEKRWLATLDKKTRHQHQQLDGQTVDVEEQFNFNGNLADGPRLFGVAGLDINCRCTTISVVNGMAPDLRRDEDSKENIDYKNYQEWYNNKVKEKAPENEGKEIKRRMDFLKAELKKFDMGDWGSLTESEVEVLYESYYEELEEVKEKIKDFDIDVPFSGSAGGIDKFFNTQEAHNSWKERLTDEDLTIIDYYTGPDYKVYNQIMREGDEAFLNNKLYRGISLESKQKEIERANKLAQIIDGYQAENSFKTYRSIRGMYEGQEWDEMIPGEYSTVLDKGYMSTSLDLDAANKFYGLNTIRLEINVKKGDKIGAYVGELSRSKDEKEFLIKPNTKFKVLSKSSRENSRGGIDQTIELEVDNSE